MRHRGRWVGSLATEARTLTVPDGLTGTRDIVTDALTAVSVAATHRRQGLLRRMLERSLAAAVDRGDAVSMLIAAEWPIYGRFGYAPAAYSAQYLLRPRRTQPLLAPPRPGTMRTVDAAELHEAAEMLFDAARRQRPGQVDRAGSWWDRRLGQQGFLVTGSKPTWIMHDGPDGVDGMLGWRVTRDFNLNDNLGAAEVSDFVAASDDAYRDLWAYLCGIDVVDEITLGDRPVDEPIQWLLHDARALQQRTRSDSVWVRLLDVPAALTARGYGRAGRVVLDVVDATTGGYAAGRYALETDLDGATCHASHEPADLRLDQRSLAAVYLGGQRLHQLTLRGVQELRPGALDLVDSMFTVARAPWTQTFF